jgi:hypothetical protein
MGLDPPLPRSLGLLCLALPGVWLAGREAAAWLSTARLLREALAPVLALAFWLLAVHAAGLASQSFSVGLVIGTLGVAAAGVAAWRRGGAPPPVGRGLGAGAWIAIALSALPVAWIAFGWAFHDEDLITGHMSIASELGNGVYPPRHLTFADLPLRYHYGFDVIVAAIAVVARTRVDTAIDVATVLLWILTGRVLWAIGRLWLGRGWPAFLLVLYAGGLPWCAFGPPLRRGGDRLAFCRVGGQGTLAPLLSSCFQHPWALGLPLALAVLLCASAPDRTRERPRLAVIAILLAALSLGHVVLFATVLPSVVAAGFLGRTRRRPREVVGLLAVAGAAGVFAVVWGPLASFGGSGAASPATALRLGVVAHIPDLARWHVQSFGPALGLALPGLWLVPRRGRAMIALLFAGSLAVLNTVRYVHSDDSLKLGVVAGIAGGLAAAATVSRIAGAARHHRLPIAALLGALAGGLTLAAAAEGLSYALVFFTPTVDRFYAHALPPMAPDDARAASFLRGRVRPGEIVFRREGPAAGYAQLGGLPLPWSDWGTATFGFPRERIDARAALLRTLPLETSPYHAEGIVWFVLDAADARVNARADAWIGMGEAEVVARFGALRVVRLGDHGTRASTTTE